MTLEIESFEWDEFNTAHLARHGLTPAEIEQVFANGAFLFETEQVGDEERFHHVGETDAARLLHLVWTLRDKKARVVTAWPIGRRSRIRVWYIAKRDGKHDEAGKNDQSGN